MRRKKSICKKKIVTHEKKIFYVKRKQFDPWGHRKVDSLIFKHDERTVSASQLLALMLMKQI